MKTKILFLSVIAVLLVNPVSAQPTNPKKDLFPAGTIFLGNIPYANDTLKKHLLDIYLPPIKKSTYPLVVWIHGGAWMVNDKYADMGYMVNTIKAFIDSGYALASIDYRYSTTAVFPAQIQDCNQAIEFLYENAGKYKLDKNHIALIGFSAGGHLASLVALSNNNKIKKFYADGKSSHFNIKLCLDFYGPSDFSAVINANDSRDSHNSVTLLLGAPAVDHPDLAKAASPVTYIDKNDPPFLIVQGEKDQSVNPEQSKLLSDKLTIAGVKNELIIVPGAPHYGAMFDTEYIRKRIFYFMDQYVGK